MGEVFLKRLFCRTEKKATFWGEIKTMTNARQIKMNKGKQ